jgi:hypothetical protein
MWLSYTVRQRQSKDMRLRAWLGQELCDIHTDVIVSNRTLLNTSYAEPNLGPREPGLCSGTERTENFKEGAVNSNATMAFLRGNIST